MKRSIGFAMLAGAAIAATMAAAPALAQEVTFAYRFEPGSTERYSVKLNQEVDMGGMAVSNIADMAVTVKCVSAKDGKFAMEMRFDKVDLSMTMMGNTSSSPIGEQLSGQTIGFTTDASGEVTDIAPVGAFEAWSSAQQLVKPVLEGWFPHLPNKAVAVGGTWEKIGDKEIESGGTETTTNAKFKFREIKKDKGRDVAIVDQVLDTTIGGNSSTPMGVYSVAGVGKGKGEFWFEHAKARVTKVKGKVDMTMDMTPQSPGEPLKTVVANNVERTLLE